MTTLKKPISRVSNTGLSGGFGPDKNRRIVITISPGNGSDVKDTFELRPHRSRRSEFITVEEVYRYAIQCRVNRDQLKRAREKKAAIAERRAKARLNAADRRFKASL